MCKCLVYKSNIQQANLGLAFLFCWGLKNRMRCVKIGLKQLVTSVHCTVWPKKDNRPPAGETGTAPFWLLTTLQCPKRLPLSLIGFTGHQSQHVTRAGTLLCDWPSATAKYQSPAASAAEHLGHSATTDPLPRMTEHCFTPSALVICHPQTHCPKTWIEPLFRPRGLQRSPAERMSSLACQPISATSPLISRDHSK